jgi:hypothetical protein
MGIVWALITLSLFWEDGKIRNYLGVSDPPCSRERAR